MKNNIKVIMTSISLLSILSGCEGFMPNTQNNVRTTVTHEEWVKELDIDNYNNITIDYGSRQVNFSANNLDDGRPTAQTTYIQDGQFKREDGKMFNENVRREFNEADKDKFINVFGLSEEGFEYAINEKINLYNATLEVNDNIYTLIYPEIRNSSYFDYSDENKIMYVNYYIDEEAGTYRKTKQPYFEYYDLLCYFLLENNYSNASYDEGDRSYSLSDDVIRNYYLENVNQTLSGTGELGLRYYFEEGKLLKIIFTYIDYYTSYELGLAIKERGTTSVNMPEYYVECNHESGRTHEMDINGYLYTFCDDCAGVLSYRENTGEYNPGGKE